MFTDDNFGTSLVISCIGLFVILMALITFIVKQSCYSTYSEYNPTWGFFSHCRIEYKGKLTPVSMIKNINIQQ